MAKTVSLIGLQNDELYWIRRLLALLRHPDPSMSELARQAVVYISHAAEKREAAPAVQASVYPANKPSLESENAYADAR